MRRLAVLGHPVAHSRSPAMHAAALAALGMDGEWSYEAIDVEPERFAERVLELPGQGFAGVNVTIPHKHAALELAGWASTAAQRIGAANTLSFVEGDVRADNTDAPGLIAALPIAPAGMRALVLGAGGAGRAAAWALVEAGAELDVWNRTETRAAELAEQLGARAVAGPLDAGAYELLVNATAIELGGAGGFFTAAPIDRAAFGPGLTVVDLVYGDGETELVAAARAAGAAVVDGIEVLVRQGAESFRIWTNVAPPLDAMRVAARIG